jgi:hypothetical protein
MTRIVVSGGRTLCHFLTPLPPSDDSPRHRETAQYTLQSMVTSGPKAWARIDLHYATREEASAAATGSNRAFRHDRLFQDELKGALIRRYTPSGLRTWVIVRGGRMATAEGGTKMAKFLIQGSYTAEGAKGLIKEGGTGLSLLRVRCRRCHRDLRHAGHDQRTRAQPGRQLVRDRADLNDTPPVCRRGGCGLQENRELPTGRFLVPRVPESGAEVDRHPSSRFQ